MTAWDSTASPVSGVLPEDRVRADYYALLARLFYAGPEPQLLAAIAGASETAGTGDGEALPLVAAWRALAAAAATADADSARHEYENVFVGTGKADITPYAAHYLAGSMQDRVLVRLREELAEMGLARREGTPEYEDHVSGLYEVMRHLIAAGSSDAAMQKQKTFFLEYLAPWYADFCATVMASPNTNFYRHVARFTKAFLDLELDCFKMI